MVLPSPSDSAAEVVAAVDLGSNSFHMIVGELRHGQMVIVDRLRETVRLAEGLTEAGKLTANARARALDCLSRFGQRLREMHAGNVRAAGTSALRRAGEQSGFMPEAEAALGHPIEIISGREEARLVYGGVVNSLPPNDGKRLVMDIGGGSTELILGRGPKPYRLESLHLGCVAMTERYFPGGAITAAAFEQARRAARLELRPVKAFFRETDGVQAIGTSGTVLATERVATELGLTDSHTLSSRILEQLIGAVLEFDTVADMKLSGLSERRAQVWPGGLAILAELIAVLRVDTLGVSDGALREGLLYDLVGRMQHEDAREQTVRAMMARYQVDESQARRVARTALELLEQSSAAWDLDDKLYAHILEWSACLLEIGLDISHDGFQRHGAYIAENADMPGFPRAEQRFLAYLIENQRRQFVSRLLHTLPAAWQESALKLSMLLRLAALMNRSRSGAELPAIRLTVTERSLRLEFAGDWLASNPLTVADLEQEQLYLAGTGYELSFS